MAYGVFESVNPYGARLYSAVCTTDVENGTVGYIDELADGETVIYKFVKGVAEGKQLVIVDQPAWDADTAKRSNQRKDKFKVEAGTVFRVRELIKGEKIGISAECVSEDTRAALDNGAYLTVGADGKFVAAAGTDSAAIFEAKVESKRTSGGIVSTVGRDYGYTRIIYVARVTTLK